MDPKTNPDEALELLRYWAAEDLKEWLESGPEAFRIIDEHMTAGGTPPEAWWRRVSLDRALAAPPSQGMRGYSAVDAFIDEAYPVQRGTVAEDRRRAEELAAIVEADRKRAMRDLP